jgi:hypothetical protein
MFREKLRKVKRLSKKNKKKLISLMEAIMKQLALIIQIEHLNNLRRSFLRLKIKDKG